MHTYSKICVHYVFGPKRRFPSRLAKNKSRLCSYISHLTSSLESKLLACNVMPDHIHILVSLAPKTSVSDFIGRTKGNISRWINKEQLTEGRFEWQRGYSAFSVSESGIPDVKKYIENQEEHHRERSYAEEVEAFLRVHGIAPVE